MTYLVFDARKASGYLFETRHKWLAHMFCVVADKLTRGYTWDYSNAFEFHAPEPMTHAEWLASEEGALVSDIMREEAERDWNEVYHYGA